MKTFRLIQAIGFSLALILTAQAQATDHGLDGNYEVHLKVGDRIFLDQMEIKGKDGEIKLQSFHGSITGTMTVPGNFTSPLSGEGHCSEKDSLCELDFDIDAHEQGQAYKVHYQAKIQGAHYQKVVADEATPVLTGTATLEDGQLLGTFEATRQ